jgi:5'(3')-deoxyribonucleotidase
MNKPILAVDVDEPIVQTGKAWKRYLDSHYTMKKEYRLLNPDPLPYDLSKMYITKEEGDGKEFFNYIKLYDNLSPREDALEFLPILSKQYDIIFCSKIVGDHFCSKVKFLDKYFPYHCGLYGTTKTKQHLSCNVFIDDCYSNLNKIYENNINTVCLRFRQDYNEGVEPITSFKIMWNWQQIYEYLNGRKNYE